MFKKRLVIGGAAVLLLLAAGVGYYVRSGRPAKTPATTEGAALASDTVGPDDKVMGERGAPITMIEYFAQACSVCARFDQEVFPLLKAKYIDTGKVRYVMRLFPLFPIDAPAYKLVLCMPPGDFFRGIDLLFRNQPQWDSAEYPGVDSPAGLMRMARIMGMTGAQAEACMQSTDHDAAINKVAQEANDRYHPDGTPTFVIDYHKVDFPQNSWEEVQAAIDAALAAKGAK